MSPHQGPLNCSLPGFKSAVQTSLAGVPLLNVSVALA